MRLVCHLQHWLGGSGPGLRVADVVPTSNSIRQWSDTFPWAEMVEAIEQSVARRFPKHSPRGRRPVPTRVLLALELLKHEVGASDEAICERLRTDVAVMYACGLDTVQLDSPQTHFVLPETLAQFRNRLDETLIDEVLAIQAAAAIDEGLVSPAHLLVDTFPAEQGSQRVTDAHTLYKAQKKSSSSSITSCSAMHSPATPLKNQAVELQHELQKVMRGFGRQCRGQAKVFVQLVRQTETQLLEAGSSIAELAQQAKQTLDTATHLSPSTQKRLTTDLSTATLAHHQIRVQNAFERLTGPGRPSFHSLASDLGVNDPRPTSGAS